ncbi:hypothetical protein D3C75_943330 [compost metagenome]
MPSGLTLFKPSSTIGAISVVSNLSLVIMGSNGCSRLSVSRSCISFRLNMTISGGLSACITSFSFTTGLGCCSFCCSGEI